MGDVCYLCNLGTDKDGAVKIVPLDLYRRRVYIEPLGIYVSLDVGTLASLELNMASKWMVINFDLASSGSCGYEKRRLRLDKLSSERPGTKFQPTQPWPFVRSAYEIEKSTISVKITWQ